MPTVKTEGSRLAAKILADRKYSHAVRDLAQLLGITCKQAADASYRNRKHILALIEAHLDASRKRQASGSWLYDRSRHILLSEALINEVAAINLMQDAAIAQMQRELERLAA